MEQNKYEVEIGRKLELKKIRTEARNVYHDIIR